jgi:hypothetical protein
MNSEALTKITKLFKDIFNGIEAFLKSDVRHFQIIRSFLKLFGGFFSLLWDILKGFEAFQIYVQRSEGFCKDNEAFKKHFQRSEGFYKFILGFYNENEAF